MYAYYIAIFMYLKHLAVAHCGFSAFTFKCERHDMP